MEYLEGINKKLASRVKNENREKITMEAKLNKIINLKELDSNFTVISDNTFFKKDSDNNASS
jgi:hypothetical protein